MGFARRVEQAHRGGAEHGKQASAQRHTARRCLWSILCGKKRGKRELSPVAIAPEGDVSTAEDGLSEPSVIEFYSYENWHHGYARVHRGDCHFCNQGKGLFGGGRTPNGEWHGRTPQPILLAVP